MENDVVKKFLHYTLFYKTGHLKMDSNRRRGGGEEVGEAGEQSLALTWNREIKEGKGKKGTQTLTITK